MIRRKFSAIGYLTALLVLPTLALAADEPKKVETPKSVEAAIHAIYADAKLSAARTDHERIDVLLVPFEAKGNSYEAAVSPDGMVIDINQKIESKDIPEAARKAIEKAAGDAKVTGYELSVKYAKVHKKTKKLTKVEPPSQSYEGHLEKDGATAEVGVSINGTIVKEPKWNKKKAAAAAPAAPAPAAPAPAAPTK
jgi:hypothetical protein